MTVDGPDSSWEASQDLIVGVFGHGKLAITNGGDASFASGVTFGFGTSEVVVDGVDSTLTFTEDLGISTDNSTLAITGGGRVTVEGTTHDGATEFGEIHFDNGTLTTGDLWAGTQDLFGVGTINTHGLFSDVDLVFDATHGPNQTFTLSEIPGQDITVNLDVDGSGDMGVGYKGDGAMRIADGVSIAAFRGIIGLGEGSTGTLTVEGVGSMWNDIHGLYIGEEGGDGTLAVTDGGVVNTLYASIAAHSGSTGMATVQGVGSHLNNSSGLYVGSHYSDDRTSGVGSLTVTDGGLVSVDGTLRLDADLNGDSFVNLATGGMLALQGEADGSITEFLDLVKGSDAIRYWDTTLPGWAHITAATEDVDYTLDYHNSGELEGYTVLTVHAVPELTTCGLALVGFCLAMFRRCH